ncbi:DUF2637 domain-containing protein [Actinomadura sp. DC4]|uniref:DUF2637 domain-containing protein n=1 Tax=Actinomadura sp. DC4 TaxID=3055069 RepID=UPI0025AF5E96|nr:DUF2637 domain-containing protein [Actinomadura sp. DC4]MDN3359855.1 DUF2637 domain-containing protein [Actinomadura sp. DC4]
MTLTPAQYSTTQRRLLSTLGGLGVAALAAGTFVLSYDDLRLLALRGGAARHWAFLYPGMLDGLVVVVILAILTARRSGWFSRALRWLLLIALIAGAGAAGVQRAVKGYGPLANTPMHVGVAVAPWAILILAVWLWVAMIKQMLSLRTRSGRSRADAPDRGIEPGDPGTEPVPATVVDKSSFIPGLDTGEIRTLPRPASIRELEPVRETVPATPPDLEENPWDAARLDPAGDAPGDPVPPSWGSAARREDTEPTTPNPVMGEPLRGSWHDPETPGDATPPDWTDTRSEEATAPHTVHAEPSDPVPESWQEQASSDLPGRDEPLLPPAPRRADEPPDTEPEQKVEAPMNDRPDEPDEEPAPRLVARTSLPTDVRLVGGPKPASSLTDTQPDGIKLPNTQPDGIPMVGASREEHEDDEEEIYADERAEDPDAGEDLTPPSSKFRSGPTPPRG